ncbi:hypothetical protein [Dysgonomonas sp. 25]|uniref:hypothetical protein n=1 Tax=Dysgonomonas sp. 25 TaxID=2302933 RepID=UPI0013D0D198|nr:hypothetical protein [Dysgonomonas sp. 25]NDV68508.1 hypothetical protein [Dysgonomonas sp. 25]
MKIKYFLLLILMFLFYLRVNAQDYNETSTHIFWQEDKLLTEKDFQGNGSAYDKSRLYCDSLDMCCVAFIGVYAVLDIPKTEKDRGRLLEKAYFVPMFEKPTSYILSENDSLYIKKQQIVFDIYELSARHARMQLEEYQKKMGSPYGTISIMFSTVSNDTKKYRDKLVKEYTNDVYLQKKENAYYIWRSFIDEKLEELKQYATTTEDRLRACTQKPIDKKYISPDTIIGNLSND